MNLKLIKNKFKSEQELKNLEALIIFILRNFDVVVDFDIGLPVRKKIFYFFIGFKLDNVLLKNIIINLLSAYD